MNKMSMVQFLTSARLRLGMGVLFLLMVSAANPTPAQQGTPIPSSLSEADVSRIVRSFTSKETEFRRALNNYSFKRDAVLQSLGMGGQVDGEFHRVSYFTFDDKGARYEKIVMAPMSTMSSVTQEDIDDLGGINPFALEPSKIDQYNFKYVGKERIDELNLYVFDVTPKAIPDPKKTKERLFTGRVWVDDQDLQIVKTHGKGVPETKVNKYPYVDTYREEIGGRYWFPTYSYADEELIFDNGTSLHVRMKVTYSDFVPAHSTVTIREADDQSVQTNNIPTPNPTVNPTPNSSASPVSSQTEAKPRQPIDRSKPLESGILNSKAIELPEPKLAEGATKLGGIVRVRVIVDETGKVISAEIEDGRIELRRAAIEAARKARFAPTLVDGQPIKVTGLITYLFVQ
ncbi:MAG: TonB family protein [Acidobacteriota bacterium]|nr:TonB family protein [Acidobacteriota bacterium]